jgi:hypothetical protein
MATRIPEARPRPWRRCTGNLKPATAFLNTGILWELVDVHGASSVTVRIKATNTGAIDLFAVGPDFDVDQLPATAYASLVGTIYATGNPTQVAVVANTEAQITFTLKGEGRIIIKFTGGATGAVTFCDVAMLPVGAR